LQRAWRGVANGEDEQLMGIFILLEEHLAVAFTTAILGVEATVHDVGLTGTGITRLCVHGEHHQPISLLDLPLPAPPPAGWEWIAVYRHWASVR
jgi:hypothetical protein